MFINRKPSAVLDVISILQKLNLNTQENEDILQKNLKYVEDIYQVLYRLTNLKLYQYDASRKEPDDTPAHLTQENYTLLLQNAQYAQDIYKVLGQLENGTGDMWYVTNAPPTQKNYELLLQNAKYASQLYRAIDAFDDLYFSVSQEDYITLIKNPEYIDAFGFIMLNISPSSEYDKKRTTLLLYKEWSPKIAEKLSFKESPSDNVKIFDETIKLIEKKLEENKNRIIGMKSFFLASPAKEGFNSTKRILSDVELPRPIVDIIADYMKPSKLKL